MTESMQLSFFESTQTYFVYRNLLSDRNEKTIQRHDLKAVNLLSARVALIYKPVN